MYKVQQITDYKIWEEFNLKQLNTLFVQSVNYGKFYQKLNENFWIFGVYNEKNELVSGTLVVSIHAKRGNFLFLPYGPVGQEGIEELFDHLKHFGRNNKYDFIRISPFWENNQSNLETFTKIKAVGSPLHILAENTWILDITKNEEELLTQMEKTHRYLINRCKKEGVTVKIFNNEQALKEFNDLHDTTAGRHHFHRFSKDYISKEFEEFTQNNEAYILQAYLPDGKLDSSAIIMFYGQMAAYRHGASLQLDKKLPTSYLLQWEAIREAKKRGMKCYNFWGVAPDGAGVKHPFKGITHFKKGFGGKQLNLIHCQDLPLNSKYWLTYTIEKLRKIKRGF